MTLWSASQTNLHSIAYFSLHTYQHRPVMFLLKKFLVTLILPPTSLILLALFGIWISKFHQKTGRAIATISLITLAALATPYVAYRLVAGLESISPISTEALSRAQAIVILGGGISRNAPEYGGDTIGSTSLERVRYGVYLQRKYRLPILVTGGAPQGGISEAEAMRDSIIKEFSGSVTWVESESLDTAENAILSARLLKQNGVNRIALVSHAHHISRAARDFEKQGLEVYPAPIGFRTRDSITLSSFTPKAGALSASANALREWGGLFVQRLR
jgi:uncharacterized SAM-binding protein YcdF (DUF218 family)